MRTIAQSIFQAGVNLGGWISQYPTFDQQHFQSFITEEDLDRIASWGMDHVRLPVDYPVLQNDDPPYSYREDGFQYIDNCLEWCDKHNLGLVLDLHKAAGFSFTTFAQSTLFTDQSLQARFIDLWETIARRYRNIGRRLVFELLNEIVLPSTQPWNELARRSLSAIRSIDPQRQIIIGGNYYNAAEQLAELDLPDDPHLTYTFHFYHPMLFTHQKASWVPALSTLSQEVHYPCSNADLQAVIARNPQQRAELEAACGLNYSTQHSFDQSLLRQALQPAIDHLQVSKAPLYCGEYGAIDQAPMDSRLNWHRDFVQLLREYGIGRAVWSYKQMDFGLVDAQGNINNQELIQIVSEI
ncbi:MAG: glycoside hydrolase family 5 protein [Anaerolineales bacterium]|nr:glycoside hydrolase family 5 protein [Anaerolineales bacterium]